MSVRCQRSMKSCTTQQVIDKVECNKKGRDKKWLIGTWLDEIPTLQGNVIQHDGHDGKEA